jgi:hypothetical protein
MSVPVGTPTGTPGSSNARPAVIQSLRKVETIGATDRKRIIEETETLLNTALLNLNQLKHAFGGGKKRKKSRKRKKSKRKKSKRKKSKRRR